MRRAGAFIAVAVLVSTSAGAQEPMRPRLPLRPATDAATNEARLPKSDFANALRTRPLDCNTAPLLSCGTSKSASLSCFSGDFFIDLYTFGGTAGQTVTIDGTATNGKTIFVGIQNSSGIILGQNYGVNTARFAYTFTTTGTYYIAVGFLEKFTGGTYLLAVSCGATTPPTGGGGCVTQTVGCNASATGQIASGDCILSAAGTRYDAWSFDGKFGDVVTATVEPLDSTLTTPGVFLRPPSGTISTPLMYGDHKPTVRYTLSSTGRWTAIVNTLDLPATGRYRISVQCSSGILPAPFQCIYQDLDCGQTGGGAINADSCKFGDSPDRYAPYGITMAAGDAVTIRATSTSFSPAVAIYRNGGDPIDVAFGPRGGTATLRRVASQPTQYELLVFGTEDNATGTYGISMTCESTCTQPTISLQPASGHVTLGAPYTFTAAAIGSPPFHYQWYRGGTGDTSVSVGSDSSSLVVTLNEPFTTWVRVKNACGSRDSVSATAMPDAPKRRRAGKR